MKSSDLTLVRYAVALSSMAACLIGLRILPRRANSACTASRQVLAPGDMWPGVQRHQAAGLAVVAIGEDPAFGWDGRHGLCHQLPVSVNAARAIARAIVSVVKDAIDHGGAVFAE